MSADQLDAHEGLQGEEDHVDEYADAAGGGGAGGVSRKPHVWGSGSDSR